MDNESRNIEELAEETRLTPRVIRYCVQKGLIKRPVRRGRRRFYDWDDLETLRKIKQLRDDGLSFAKIREELRSQIPEARTKYELMLGLELHESDELGKRRKGDIKDMKDYIQFIRLVYLEKFFPKSAPQIAGKEGQAEMR